MDKNKQILARIIPLVVRLGVKSITMQQIAKELGISKKTLYLHFDSKADMIHQALELHLEMEHTMINEVIKEEKNAIDEIIEIGRFVINHLKELNPTNPYDIKRLYPKTFKLFEKHKLCIGDCIKTNLKKGIEQGLYRTDFDIEIITHLYVSKIDAIIDTNIFPISINKADIYREMLKYHIHGVASEKGTAYFTQYLKTVNQTKETI